MYAYIRDGKLEAFSEEELQIAVPEQKITIELEAEDGSKSEQIETVPAVPGIQCDAVIEYDFGGETPIFENGELVPYSESQQKIDDDKRMADEEAARKETRKSEIRAEIWLLAKERDGLAELGADSTDKEYADILERIEALKNEYATL